MSQGQLAAMIHRWAPGCPIAVLDTIFRTPLVVGTKPRVPGRRDRHQRRDPHVEIDLTIANEAGETRVVGTARVALP